VKTGIVEKSETSRIKTLLLLMAAAIVLAGVLRYVRAGSFTLRQAAFCLAAIPLAMLALLVLDYTVHHARLVALMFLLAIILLAVQIPAFCIGLGLGLAGMLLAQR
jgi:phosphatidylserine synthase